MYFPLFGLICLLILAMCINTLVDKKRLRDVKKDRNDVADELEVVIEQQNLKNDKSKLKKQEEKL